MITENKPREFMIFDGCMETPKISQLKGLPIAYAENVHVIEYSAYEQLKAELKESNDSWQRERLSAANYQVIEQLKSKLAKLEEICRGIRRNYVGPDSREKAMRAVNDLDEYLKGVK